MMKTSLPHKASLFTFLCCWQSRIYEMKKKQKTNALWEALGHFNILRDTLGANHSS